MQIVKMPALPVRCGSLFFPDLDFAVFGEYPPCYKRLKFGLVVKRGRDYAAGGPVLCIDGTWPFADEVPERTACRRCRIALCLSGETLPIGLPPPCLGRDDDFPFYAISLGEPSSLVHVPTICPSVLQLDKPKDAAMAAAINSLRVIILVPFSK